MYIHIYLNHFAIQPKLIHCKSTTFQFLKYILKYAAAAAAAKSQMAAH